MLLFWSYSAYMSGDILMTIAFGGVGLFVLIGAVIETRKVEKSKQADKKE